MQQFEDFWSNDKHNKKRYLSTAVVIGASIFTLFVGTKIVYSKYQASVLNHQKGGATLQNNIGEVRGASATNNTPSSGSTTPGAQTNKTSTKINAFGYQSPTNPSGTPTNPNTSYSSIDNPSYSPDPTSPISQSPYPDNTQEDKKRIAKCIAQNQKRHDVLDPVKEQIYGLQNYYAQIPDIMADKVKGTFTNQAQLDRMIQAEQQKTQSEINQLQLQYDQLSSQYPSCSY